MTMQSESIDPMTADLAAVAAAIAPLLPAEHGLTVRTESTGSWLPGRSARAVSVSVAGTDGECRITLIVSEMIAEAVELGPEGIIELPVALAPVLQHAVLALGLDGSSMGAPVPDDAAAAARVPTGVALDDGDRHAASLLVHLPVATRPAAAFAPAAPAAPAAPPMTLEAVMAETAAGPGTTHRPIEFLSDVELAVTAELGRTKMTVRELLRLGSGSVVELDRAAGSQVDLLVNGRLIARGVVVVVDDEFGVRVSEVVARDRGLGGAPA
jgi:flagellar motor switch protein FliN/FliY